MTNAAIHILPKVKEHLLVKHYLQDDKTPAYRIMIDGLFLTTRSGKTVWKRKGDAKSALKNHLYNDRYHYIRKSISNPADSIGWRELECAYDEALNYLIEDGFVKIVAVNNQ